LTVILHIIIAIGIMPPIMGIGIMPVMGIIEPIIGIGIMAGIGIAAVLHRMVTASLRRSQPTYERRKLCFRPIEALCDLTSPTARERRFASATH